MKKVNIILLLIVFVTALSGASKTYSKTLDYPEIDTEKREQCQISILNYLGKAYQLINEARFEYLYSFEKQDTSRFKRTFNTTDELIYCYDNIFFGYFPIDENSERIRVRGRWGYHLFSYGTFDEMFMVLDDEGFLKNVCRDGYRPYVSHSLFIYSIISYHQDADGGLGLQRVETDEELVDTFYYKNVFQYENNLDAAKYHFSKAAKVVREFFRFF